LNQNETKENKKKIIDCGGAAAGAVTAVVYCQ